MPTPAPPGTSPDPPPCSALHLCAVCPQRILATELLSGLRAIRLAPAPPGTPSGTRSWGTLDTPFGPMLLSERDGSIASICFLDGRHPGRVLAGLRERWLEAQFLECAQALEPYRRYLVQAMGGAVPVFQPLPPTG